jgi:hypothetical protein
MLVLSFSVAWLKRSFHYILLFYIKCAKIYIDSKFSNKNHYFKKVIFNLFAFSSKDLLLNHILKILLQKYLLTDCFLSIFYRR